MKHLTWFSNLETLSIKFGEDDFEGKDVKKKPERPTFNPLVFKDYF